MTAPIGTDLPGRCTTCGMDPRPEVQGHRPPCAPTGHMANLLLAREARDAGMAATTAAHPDAVSLIDAAIMRRIKAGRPFSANVIRAELVSLKPSERPAIGARMNALARKWCVKVGEEPSTDVKTHGKALSIWQAAA